MKRRSSAWDRRKCETAYRWNRLRRSPSPLMACCWFPASSPSATPATDSCRNPNGLPVPKVLAPQHNNSFINSALKSGAAVSVSNVSPTSRLTCPPRRSLRNALSRSLLPSAMPMDEIQKAKAEAAGLLTPLAACNAHRPASGNGEGTSDTQHWQAYGRASEKQVLIPQLY